MLQRFSTGILSQVSRASGVHVSFAVQGPSKVNSPFAGALVSPSLVGALADADVSLLIAVSVETEPVDPVGPVGPPVGPVGPAVDPVGPVGPPVGPVGPPVGPVGPPVGPVGPPVGPVGPTGDVVVARGELVVGPGLTAVLPAGPVVVAAGVLPLVVSPPQPHAPRDVARARVNERREEGRKCVGITFGSRRSRSV
jgi:hypothetical protein